MEIYIIRNKINNKVYIGQTVSKKRKRLVGHFYDAENRLDRKYRLANAIRKYGRDNFYIETLETVDSIEMLNEREVFWIKHFQSNHRDYGYNTMEGGKNSRLSEETKEKMREIAKRKKEDGTFVDNSRFISHKQKEQHPMWGKKHTEEAKKKIGDSRRGKPLKEFMSKESYSEHIATMKKNFSGDRHHHYIPVSKEDIIQAVKDKKTEKEIYEGLGVSRSAFYYKLMKIWGHMSLSKLRKEYENQN